MKVNESPLNLAIRKRNIKIIKLLLEPKFKQPINLSAEDVKNPINEIYDKLGILLEPRKELLNDFEKQKTFDSQTFFLSSFFYPKSVDEIFINKDNKLLAVHCYIDDVGYYVVSKIQEIVIPLLYKQNKDLLVQSQFGTGKTILILCSMLLNIYEDLNQPQALYLCNSRELSIQTFKIFTSFTLCRLKGSLCCLDVEAPSKDAQLLFGTNDSFDSLIEKKEIDLSQVNLICIDEADLIMTKGLPFYEPTIKLIEKLPQDAHCQFFSSTFSPSSISTIKSLRKGIQCILDSKYPIFHNVKHYYTRSTNEEDSMNCILELCNKVEKEQIIIFANSIEKVDLISNFLNSKGIECRSYHSNLTSTQKDDILNDFRNNKIKAIAGTYILSRGIDLPNTFLVINYQVPLFDNNTSQKVSLPESDVYEHCASRAGRFSRNGICFTITTNNQEEEMLLKFCSDIFLVYIDQNQLKDK